MMKIPLPEDRQPGSMEMAPSQFSPDDDDDTEDGLTYPAGRRPRVEKRRLPARTCGLAIVLTTIGTCLLLTALTFFLEDKDGGLELVLLAALTLCPGVYASWMLMGIKLRWPGYDNVVIFNDDIAVPAGLV